jgi:hypothetical protein
MVKFKNTTDMKNLKKIFLYHVLLFTLFALIWVSCKEKEIEELELSRRFRPALFDITNGETSATLEWSPSLFTLPGEVEYLIELSKDGTGFSNVEYSTTTASPAIVVLDTDIDIRENYFARVKAIGSDGVDDSHWLVSDPFQITGEIFILPVSESDVVVDVAVINWQPEDVLTKIVITAQGGTPEVRTISAEEAEAGKKIVDRLTQNTQYTVEIFKGEVPKGSVTFRTKPSYEGSTVIDLTGISGKPSILTDTLPDIPAGSVVLLKRGETYQFSSYDLDRSVTITSGADFISAFATITTSGNFNIVAASEIDSLIFKDLNLIGDDFNGDYVFNINREGTIGKVRFDNVRGHSFRGFFRMQTGALGTQLQDLIINNCVIDSLREFALAWTNNSNSIANIRITNSTVHNARRVISHSSPGSNSIIIENCTFHNAPSGGLEGAEPNYFIDLATNNSANPIIISNTIIGRGWNEGVGDYVRGIRTAGSTANVSNSYSTSDYLSTNASFQIPGLLAYPGNSSGVFTDPASGDFTIKDAAFPGADNAGDPRWRP